MLAPPRNETEFALSSPLAQRVQSHPALARVDHLLREFAGLRLLVLLREPRGTMELYPAGGNDELPEFCRIFRAAPQGGEQCRACRTMAAFSAFYQGLHEYTCHGGVHIIAGPAIGAEGTPSRSIAVASCAFVGDAPGRGWESVRQRLRASGVAMRSLGRAFRSLPRLQVQQRRIALDLTEIAAHLLGSIEDAAMRAQPVSAARDAGADYSRDACGQLLSALANKGFSGTEETRTLASFLDLVAAMIQREPAAPYTVARLATLINVTPNYFSISFRKRTGKTFQAYLTEARIQRACDLLRSTGLDVGEIARRSGFRDPAYFSRRFRQSRGCSPTVWRAGQ